MNKIKYLINFDLYGDLTDFFKSSLNRLEIKPTFTMGYGTNGANIYSYSGNRDKEELVAEIKKIPEIISGKVKLGLVSSIEIAD